jgi:hypothetical protein
LQRDKEDPTTNLNAPVDNPCIETTLTPGLFDEVITEDGQSEFQSCRLVKVCRRIYKMEGRAKGDITASQPGT